MAPAYGLASADSLLQAGGLGILLALYYEFLTPLRKKRSWPGDLLFLPGLLWLYSLLAFGICRTDLRLYHLICFLGTALLWQLLAGPYVLPVFFRFWSCIGGILSFFLRPLKYLLKIIIKFSKNHYAIWKKSVTIVKYIRKKDPKKTGGVPDGKKEAVTKRY